VTEKELFTILAERIGETHSPSVWGECNQINSTIAKYLTLKGFKVQCVAGYVKCDNPTTVDWIHDPKHFWIKYNGKILDFAAQQFSKSFFNETLNELMSRDYFHGECDSYIEVADHPIDNEWVEENVTWWTDINHEDYISYDDEDSIKRVYRLEHVETGLGPFQEGMSDRAKELFSEYWDKLEENVDIEAMFPPPDKDPVILNNDSIPQNLKYRFACLTEEEVILWFSAPVVEELKKHGFIIKELLQGEDFDISIRGTNQVVIFNY